MEKNQSTLTPSDLNFILTRCPKDILKLLKDNAGELFLAGGFIRSTIAGDKVSDIDLFGTSAEKLLQIAKDLTLERKGRFFKTDNAITVLAPPRIPAQFITRWVFSSGCYEAIAEMLIKSFDFTICQAVIWAEEIVFDTPEEKGKKKYVFHSRCSSHFYSDLAAKRLVYTFPQREEEAGGSFMRVIKFVKKGFNVQAPTLAGVTARIVSKLYLEKDMTYRHDGTIDEKWVAQVMVGLLRQVDPLTIVDGVDFVDEHEVI
jgi:hypothetical protein